MIPADILINGYLNGIFPMADDASGEIYWYSPDPRAIIPIYSYKCQKSLRSVINKKVFEIKIDSDFEAVIRSCSKERFEGDGVWISEDIIASYLNLNKLGFAHSVEAYFEGKLAGGLYGVALGSVFYGESMFFNKPNASKVAFHYLIEILKFNDFQLLDTQFINDNVKRFGAIEIPRRRFQMLLKDALKIETSFILPE